MKKVSASEKKTDKKGTVGLPHKLTQGTKRTAGFLREKGTHKGLTAKKEIEVRAGVRKTALTR